MALEPAARNIVIASVIVAGLVAVIGATVFLQGIGRQLTTQVAPGPDDPPDVFNLEADITPATDVAPGTYQFRFKFREHMSDPVTLVVEAPTTNQPPAIEPLTNQSIQTGTDVIIAALANDDGLPNPPATLSYSWEVVSAPNGGTLTMLNGDTSDVTINADTDGEYVLRVTVSDSALEVTADVTLTASASGSDNVAPTITMDNSLNTIVGTDTDLNASVTDDGLPVDPGTVISTWSMVSGPGSVSFSDTAAPTTTATFSASGDYVIRISATDGELTTEQNVAVTVSDQSEEPPVDGSVIIDFDIDNVANVEKDKSVDFPITIRAVGLTDEEINDLNYSVEGDNAEKFDFNFNFVRE